PQDPRRTPSPPVAGKRPRVRKRDPTRGHPLDRCPPDAAADAARARASIHPRGTGDAEGRRASVHRTHARRGQPGDRRSARSRRTARSEEHDVALAVEAARAVASAWRWRRPTRGAPEPPYAGAEAGRNPGPRGSANGGSRAGVPLSETD